MEKYFLIKRIGDTPAYVSGIDIGKNSTMSLRLEDSIKFDTFTIAYTAIELMVATRMHDDVRTLQILEVTIKEINS